MSETKIAKALAWLTGAALLSALLCGLWRVLVTEAWEFMPHGHCWAWRPELLVTSVLSDAAIATAYYTIPVLLWLSVRKKVDAYPAVSILFSAFILACGTTHVLDIWTIWAPHFYPVRATAASWESSLPPAHGSAAPMDADAPAALPSPDMTGRVIPVTEGKSDPPRIVAELRIAGRLLYDANIKPGDFVTVEVVKDGELVVRRV